jgi:hypothetical protein
VYPGIVYYNNLQYLTDNVFHLIIQNPCAMRRNVVSVAERAYLNKDSTKPLQDDSKRFEDKPLTTETIKIVFGELKLPKISVC